MAIFDENLAVNLDEETIEQRKRYLHQADAVARELCRLTSVSDRTLGLLTDTEADAQLLDAIQQKSNDLLALQQRLHESWALQPIRGNPGVNATAMPHGYGGPLRQT